MNTFYDIWIYVSISHVLMQGSPDMKGWRISSGEEKIPPHASNKSVGLISSVAITSPVTSSQAYQIARRFEWRPSHMPSSDTFPRLRPSIEHNYLIWDMWAANATVCFRRRHLLRAPEEDRDNRLLPSTDCTLLVSSSYKDPVHTKLVMSDQPLKLNTKP